MTIPAGKAWRGCGSHVQQVFAGVPEKQWCTCSPRTKINGKEYPPPAKFEIPGLRWLTNVFGGGDSAGSGGAGQPGGGDGKREL